MFLGTGTIEVNQRCFHQSPIAGGPPSILMGEVENYPSRTVRRH